MAAFNPTLFGVDPTKVSAEAESARSLLLSRIVVGQEQQKRIIKACSEQIPRDRYVHPHLMRFKRDKEGRVVINYAQGPNHDRWSKYETTQIHSHALGQLADTSDMDRRYVAKLNQPSVVFRGELLAHNLNELFHKHTYLNRAKQEAEFLHRLVGNELRGFLTQSYNRHLLSMPLLMAFIEACQEVDARPMAGFATDTKVSLQCYLPWGFEIVHGDFVAMGVQFGNSDFGDGKLKVSHTFMRVRGFATGVMEESFSRVHLGSVVRDSDLRLSDDVAKKEIETVALAIKDAVQQVLQPASVEKLISLLQRAAAEEIPWEKLRGNLSKVLNKEDVGTVKDMLEKRIEDLPPPGIGKDGRPLATRWWAAAAVAMLADKEIDVSRSSDLKEYAGKLLGETNVEQ
jgi:hypothetical protein